ncbi:MAG: site-specific integrase [Leadbetterella sp.]|nr:site-specific integrase [Leadbetterella sp.]
MKVKTTVSIYLDKRYPVENNEFPLKLRLISNRISRLYAIGVHLTVENFAKLHSTKLKDRKLLEVRDICTEAKTKAEEIIKSMETFSFDEFKRLYLGQNNEANQPKPTVVKNLVWFYHRYIEELKSLGRVSTYQSINNSLRSLTNFQPDIDFIHITPKFLWSYEKWMLEKGKSITTVGIYIRSLRVILNLAIEEGIVSKESYPFGKRKYVIPTGRNIKKALSTEELKKIFEFKPPLGTPSDKARDFWIFSYLCLGLNLADIARIKLKDIKADKITLIRQKTKGAKRGNSKSLEIFIHPIAQKVIEKWGIPYGGKEDYLFDILKPDFTPEQIRSSLQNFNKLINKYMSRIGKELNINKSLNFYSGRHSSATMLLRSGVSLESISEGLGHTDTRTTQAYLSSLEDSDKKELINFLILF